MRNIIITGGGMVNKGAQAMTLIAVHELRERFPDHEVYLYSPVDLANPQLDKSQFDFNFTGWYPIKFAHCQQKPLLRAITLLRSRAELLEAEAIYRNTDFIVDISGYALGSNWSDKVCNDFLDVIEFAKGFGIPVYLMPQSFGPFDFGPERQVLNERIRKLLPTCKAILAREQEGYDALVNTYGLPNVQLAPDLVLNNKGIDLNKVFKNVPTMDLPEIKKGSIGVVPNGRNLAVGNGDQVFGLYQTAISHARSKKKTVYLLHHASSDAEICKKLKEHFHDDENVVLLGQEFSCLEFNELVKCFDYLVASRFHSIVHAFKNGIPCITLGWATKYKDLLAQFEQSAYLFDVRNNPNAEKLCEAMDVLDSRKADESVKILSHLAEVTKKNVFDIIKL